MSGADGVLVPELESRFEPIVIADPHPGPASSWAIASALTLGCVSLLMLGVQPMVLGALVSAHRLTVSQLTQSATVEMLALGIVAGAMAGLLQHRRLRLWGAAACVLLCASNLGSLVSGGEAFVLSRAAAGASGGILVWLVTGVITRTQAPVRLTAAFAAAQSISQAALAAVIPLIAPKLGANAGLVVLAGLAAVTAILLPLIPSRLPDLQRPETGHGALSFRSGAGLLGAFLLMAGIVGLWVFADELAKMDGVSPAIASTAIAASLAMQVGGAVFVVALGPRLTPGRGLIFVCLGYLVVAATIAWTRNSAAFVAAVLLLGFLWNVGLSLTVPLLIAADPTRRAAMLTAGAQLLGGSAGPQITGLFATDTDVRLVLPAAAALFVGAIACIAITIAPRRAR